MSSEIPKAYEPKEVEEKIYKLWEKGHFFTPEIKKNKRPFVVAIPLPNITGSLHMGHALNNSIQDIAIRYHRMKQEPTLWMPGTDHAGIATQNKVEKALKKEGLSRHDLGREKFIEKVWEWKEKYGNLIIDQLKKLGCSCDWSRTRFTLDKDYVKAVETAFLHYYKKGWIYQGPRIVNWCPRCSTAISDIEIKYVPHKTKLWYIKYPIAPRQARGDHNFIIVATTRPETMLGDTALAVNPKDKRYKDLIDKYVILPLMNREIPIIADRLVESEFGTGAVKITPAHDAVDNKIGKNHKLETINVIGEDGKMTEKAGAYTGMDILKARNKIIEDLKSQNLLEKEEDYEHSLAICDRCETPIEPLISKQWFVRMSELAKPAIKVVKENKIKFFPARYKKVYLDWMENIEDWCISRQIWWGHRLPVYSCGPETGLAKPMGFYKKVVPQLFTSKTKTYRLHDHWYKIGDRVAFHQSGTNKIIGFATITNVEEITVGRLPLHDPAHGAVYQKRQELIAALQRHNIDIKVDEKTKAFIYTYEFAPTKTEVKGCGEIIVSFEQPKKCSRCGNTKLSRNPDTLDTWFSSALWPFAHLGWPKKTKDLEYFYPTTLLSTARDILYLWVARMIFSGLEFMKKIPFKDVYIHPTVLNIEGKRMSKSLGTGVDPTELIDKYGADATRFGLLYLTSLEQQQIKFSEDAIQASKNFCNKLWNINRFIWLSGETKPSTLNAKCLTLVDKWILSRLNTIIENTTKNLEEYKLGESARELYDFVWHEYADWYIEISKIPPRRGEARQGRQNSNPYIFKTILQLLHPFMPFITEYIWQLNYQEKKPLIISEWPKADKKLIDKKTETKFEKIKQKIIEIRKKNPERKLQDIWQTLSST